MARYDMRTAMRAACVDFLDAYRSAASIKLQVYPARPRSINPPTAFVDNVRETISYTGLNQRTVLADVIVIHRIFDSMDAANQGDRFVDGLIDYSMDNVHGAGANTTVAVTEVEDLPDYIADWMPPNQQETYYASRITFEGLSLTG